MEITRLLVPASPLPLLLLATLACGAGASAQAPLIPGGESCAAAISVDGLWSFQVDNSNAATGPGGQNHDCYPGSPGATNDLWYAWTAPKSGLAEFDTCGTTSFPTRIFVYRDSACPPGTPIECADDNCDTGSLAEFYVETGESFLVQIGSRPGEPTGIAEVRITVRSPDACATPIDIQGVGTFPFDNSRATASSEGQGQAACIQAGAGSIGRDVWYAWEAPSTGTVTISTCGTTAVDTVLAVYLEWPGLCPTTPAIACNDDTCGFQSQVQFAATADQYFLIQVGTRPTSLGGTGSFQIQIDGDDCAYDDGVSEGVWGRVGGGTSCWLQTFGAPESTEVLSTVSVVYGTAAHAVDAPANGTRTTIAIWEDPDDDGNPDDAVLIRTQMSAVDGAGTDVYQVTNLVPPLAVSGRYFVGVIVTHPAGTFPASTDSAISSIGRMWFTGGPAGTFDAANLAGNADPLYDVGAYALGVHAFLIRAGCDDATGGYSECHSGAPNFVCPSGGPGCGNGMNGRGCANSVNPQGALLAARGSASVLSDSLRLFATGLPSSTSALIFQGSSIGATPAAFGDGLRCVSGSVIRLATKNAGALGTVDFGHGVAGDPPVSERGHVFAPGDRWYQVWYRNSASFCTPGTFNLTNAVGIDWY